MREWREQRIWWAYVIAEALQLVLFNVVMGAQVGMGGVWFMAVLLFGVRRRWHLAWVILVLVNAVPTLAALAVFAPGAGASGILWTNFIVLVLTGLLLETLLFSPAMRAYVGLSREPAGVAEPVT
ncbi:MAG TPA: hypothetical protein VF781_11990 [Solirubrobacteraceae bacterium]